MVLPDVIMPMRRDTPANGEPDPGPLALQDLIGIHGVNAAVAHQRLVLDDAKSGVSLNRLIID